MGPPHFTSKQGISVTWFLTQNACLTPELCANFWSLNSPGRDPTERHSAAGLGGSEPTPRPLSSEAAAGAVPALGADGRALAVPV